MTIRYKNSFFPLLGAVLLLLASCGGKEKRDYPKVQTDSVVIGTALPVDSGRGRAVCEVAIRYDYVQAAPTEEVRRKINDRLLAELLGQGYAGSGIRQALDSFRTDYEKRYRREMMQLRSFAADYGTALPAAQGYRIELDSRLVYNCCGIATFHCLLREQAAGAEPETRERLLNFDVQTGDLLSLDDLFAEGYEERIDAMLLKELLAANRVRTLAELEELGYFSSSSLYPSPNFRIAGEKLLFLYNPADGVGPYDADVATVVGLDLDALSLLFSENSPLRRVEE